MLIIGLWNSHHALKNTVHNLGKKLSIQIIRDIESIYYNQILRSKKIRKQEEYCLWQFLFKNQRKLNILLLDGCINNTGLNLAEIDDNYIEELIENNEIIAAYDDTTISTGKILFSYNKGSSFHNGPRGIDIYLKKEYWRVRIGITKPEDIDNNTFVLSYLPENHKSYQSISKVSILLLENIIKSKEKDNKILLSCIQTKINTEMK